MDLGGCGSSEPFALQVTDNSMEPEFKRGCIIVVDPAGVIEHGCYVVAMVENGYIFRQLVKQEGKYFIQPLHEDYLHEKREIQLEAVQGVVVQQAGNTGRRADRKRYTSM